MTEEEIRYKVIRNIDDLRKKIIDNEPFPESPQDIQSLLTVNDAVNEILSYWYY